MGIIYFGSGLILLIALWYIWAVNNLIAKRNRVKQCRSGICVALKQRNDMIPNLVAAVKSYMGHENEILTRITELRSHSFQPSQENHHQEELIDIPEPEQQNVNVAELLR